MYVTIITMSEIILSNPSGLKLDIDIDLDRYQHNWTTEVPWFLSVHLVPKSSSLIMHKIKYA